MSEGIYANLCALMVNKNWLQWVTIMHGYSAVSHDLLRGVSGCGQGLRKLEFMTILVCLIHM